MPVVGGSLLVQKYNPMYVSCPKWVPRTRLFIDATADHAPIQARVAIEILED